MKFVLIFYLLLVSLFTWAQPPRLQDQVPVDVSYQINATSVQFKFTYRRDILGFSVVNVRGVGGLSPEGELNSVPKDVLAGQSDSITYTFTKDEGKAYLILDLRGTVDGMRREQFFSVAIGSPTEEQRKAGIDEDINVIQADDRTFQLP